MLVGHIDRIEEQISGWAYDTARPAAQVDLAIIVNGAFLGQARADRPRPDLVVLGTGFTDYGFSLPSPAGLSPQATVFAACDGQYVLHFPPQGRTGLAPRVHHAALVMPGVPERTMSYNGAAPLDDLIVARIRDAAVRTAAHAPVDFGPLWGVVLTERFAEFWRLVHAGDLAALGARLSEWGAWEPSIGILDGPDAAAAGRQSADWIAVNATMVTDRILSLAESIGCLLVENPEQGPFGALATQDPAELMDAVARTLGIDLRAPVGGFWGVPTRFGPLNMRAVDAIHAAHRIRQVMLRHDLKGVLEIGGGAGLVAHYGLLMGVDAIRTLDLPEIGAAQAYALRLHAGLRLHGEPPFGARVEVLPPWELSDPHGRFDLMFNMDSFPEIEAEAATTYLRDGAARGCRYLLSINRESGYGSDATSDGSMRHVAARAGGLTLVARDRDWLRPGYVEELYAFGPA